jgi:hypothetical protein
MKALLRLYEGVLSPHLVSVAQAPLSRLNLHRRFTPLSLAPAPALAIALALALHSEGGVWCVIAQAHVMLAHKRALLFQRRCIRRSYSRQRELAY